jgi:GNAT superfamily N-acetyltransferase
LPPPIANHPLARWLKRLLSGVRLGASTWIFSRGKAYLFELRLSDALPPAAQERNLASNNCDFREAALDELPQCAALAELPAAETQRRYDRGDRCFVVFEAGRPIIEVWLHFGSCYIRGPGLLLQLGEGDAYVYGVFVDSAHRGRGLYKLALEEVALMLARRGIKRIVQVVEEGKEIPLKTLPKLGYRLCGAIRHRTLFHRKQTTVTDVDGRRVQSQIHWRTPPDGYWI